jgi:hypothetical protein
MDDNARSWAILAAVYATFALDVFSTFTSSPQTTEINADTRADTLMKWVKIGFVVALAGGVVGTITAKSAVPLVATSAVGVGMYLMYEHAKNTGLKNGGPGTEGQQGASTGW